jgi:predicted phage terminase large subunit-like protein
MNVPSSSEADRILVRKGGFPAFVKLVFPYVEPGREYQHNWHIDLICKHLEDVRTGRTRRLAIHVPPGSMKSLLVSVLWPIYQWILDPTVRVFSVSHDGDLSREHASRSRDVILSDWFQERWGHLFSVDPSSPAGYYSNNRGGWRRSRSIGEPIVGGHCDVCIIDDPHTTSKPCSTFGDAATWFRVALPTRFRDQKKARVVLVMQRLSEVDLGAEAEKRGYVILRLPMRAEEPVCPGDPRQPGDLLWPERFPEEEVARVEADMGSIVAAGQYQQRPSPAGGALVREVHLQRAWSDMPRRFEQACLSVDCTFSAKPGSDYVSITAWGRLGQDFYLLDEVHARLNVAGTVANIKGLLSKFPFIRKVLVERAANGEAVMESLTALGVPGVEGVSPQGTSKLARFQICVPLFEQLRVVLPAHMPTLDEYRHELLVFTGESGFPDDRVDSTSMALRFLSTNTRGDLVAAMAVVSGQRGPSGIFGGSGYMAGLLGTPGGVFRNGGWE